MPHLRSLALLLAAALLTGCASSDGEKSGFHILPRVFKFPIQQGNIVTQDMVDKLQPGMTRAQVRFVMGTPLIADTFNQNRWDYLYTLKKPSGELLREQMTIQFDGDRLVSISGDYMPSSAANAAAPAAEPEAPVAPAEPQPKGGAGKSKPATGKSGAPAKPAAPGTVEAYPIPE
jgi:outer membrane protein assembly factor BamE